MTHFYYYTDCRGARTSLLSDSNPFSGLLVEANPDVYSHLLATNRKSFSVGQCLSTKNRPEVVLFDAADIFGGILRDGESTFLNLNEDSKIGSCKTIERSFTRRMSEEVALSLCIFQISIIFLFIRMRLCKANSKSRVNEPLEASYIKIRA
jgi:hypothetical protein